MGRLIKTQADGGIPETSRCIRELSECSAIIRGFLSAFVEVLPSCIAKLSDKEVADMVAKDLRGLFADMAKRFEA